MAMACAAVSPAPAKAHKVAKRALCPFINTQIIEAANTGNVHIIMATVKQHLPDMNLVNLTTALHRLAKVCSENEGARVQMRCEAYQQTLQDILAAITVTLQRCDQSLNDSRRQALGNIVWSLGTLRCVQLQLLEVAVNLAMGQLAAFKPFELASTIWAFAKLGSLHPAARTMVAPVQVAAVGPLGAVVGKLGFRFLSMAAWALVASGLSQEPVLAKIAGRVLPMLRGQDSLPELLVDVAWAFSSAGLRHERLLAEVGRQAGRDLSRFSSAELVDLSQILAAEDIECPEFYQACAAYGAVVPMALDHSRTPQSVAAVARSPLRAAAAEFVPSADAFGACSLDAAKVEAQRATGSTTVGEEADACDQASEAGSSWSESEGSETEAGEGSRSSGTPARGSRAWADVNEDVDANDAPEFAPLPTPTKNLPRVLNCSVKNTFLELADEEAAASGAALLRRLAPALDLALAACGPEALDEARVRYQQLRVW